MKILQAAVFDRVHALATDQAFAINDELATAGKRQPATRSKSTPPSKSEPPLLANGEVRPRSKPRSKSQRRKQPGKSDDEPPAKEPQGRYGGKDSRIAHHEPSERDARKAARRARRKDRGHSKSRSKAKAQPAPSSSLAASLSLPKTKDQAPSKNRDPPRKFMVAVSDSGEVLQLVEVSPSDDESSRLKRRTPGDVQGKNPPSCTRGRGSKPRSKNASRGGSVGRDRSRAREIPVKPDSDDDKTQGLELSDGGDISSASQDDLSFSKQLAHQVKKVAKLYIDDTNQVLGFSDDVPSTSQNEVPHSERSNKEEEAQVKEVAPSPIPGTLQDETPSSKQLATQKEFKEYHEGRLKKDLEAMASYSSRRRALSSRTRNSALSSSLRSSLRSTKSTLSKASARTTVTGLTSGHESVESGSYRSVGFKDDFSSVEEAGRVYQSSRSLTSQEDSSPYRLQSRGRPPVTGSVSKKALPGFPRPRSLSRTHAHNSNQLTSSASSQDHAQSVASWKSAPGHLAPRQARLLSRLRKAIKDHIDLDPATGLAEIQRSFTSHLTAETAMETFLSSFMQEESGMTEDDNSVLSDQSVQAVVDDDPLMNSTVTLFEDNDDQSVLSEASALTEQGRRAPRDASPHDGGTSTAKDVPMVMREKDLKQGRYSKLQKINSVISNDSNQAVAEEDLFMNSDIALFGDDGDQSVLSGPPPLINQGPRASLDARAKNMVGEDPKETLRTGAAQEMHLLATKSKTLWETIPRTYL